MSHHNVYEAINGRLFIVGDVHGEHSKLMSALKLNNFDFNKDQLICCGDLIDRGQESMEMIKLIEEPWFHAVKGNHDKYAIAVFDSIMSGTVQDSRKLIDAWVSPENGGGWFFELSDKEKEYCLTRGRDLLSSMPTAITASFASGLRIGIVHADPLLSHWDSDYYEKIDDREEWQVITSRDASQRKTAVTGVDAVCVGHTIISNKPENRANVIFCDTGGWNVDRRIELVAESELQAMLNKNLELDLDSNKTKSISANFSRHINRT